MLICSIDPEVKDEIKSLHFNFKKNLKLKLKMKFKCKYLAFPHF